MEMNRKYHRDLQWVAVKDCYPDEEYAIYVSVERKDLGISVGKSGVIQPFTGIVRDGNIVIIDGRERLKAARDKFDENYKVPVWIISETLTDSELKWLVLDLERTRQKNYVDLMNEYNLYNSLIPNRRGQKDVERHRTLVICDLMGISKSQLMRLLRIDKISPSLLHAVDSGLITLEGARRKADEIKRKREQDDLHTKPDDEKEETKGCERIYRDRVIDLSDLTDECPSCNRRFETIEYDDIQDIFNVNRKDNDFQTDWLQDVA